MKTTKKAKPLLTSTIGDLTDRTCGFCGLNLQFTKVDRSAKTAWLSCPIFLSERKFSKNEHSSFTVPLDETGYVAGDEEKFSLPAKDASAQKRPQHDRPEKTGHPPGAFGRRGSS